MLFFLELWEVFVVTQSEYELAMVNESSVFELLRFDCTKKFNKENDNIR